MLDLEDVTRSFSGRRVLGPISLRASAGSVCAISGRNGSGKTTLLRLAAGVLAPSSGRRWGSASSLYIDARTAGRSAQSVAGALRFVAQVSGRDRTAIGPALEAVGLSGSATSRVGELSSGQRARLAMAVARITAPAVLCLDEPGVHLDIPGRRMVQDSVAELCGRGCVVLFSAHDLDLLESMADRVVRLDAGQALR